MRPRRGAAAVLAVLLLAGPVLGHVPSFPESNTAPERAVHVPDAAKSWSFYDRLSAGQVRYYRLSIGEGERLVVGAFTPDAGPFTPSVVLMGPSVEGGGEVPPHVTVPDGMGALVVRGERPATAAYEPFSPSAYYHTVDAARSVPPGEYLLAVYEPRNRSGPVGVVVGYEESFSVAEYLAVPVDLLRVHRWEGQHPALVVGPLLLTLAAGLLLVRRRRLGTGRERVVRAAVAVAGTLVLASGLNTAVQTVVALSRSGPTAGALVTAVFVVVPTVVGAWVLLVALRGPMSGGRTRAGLAAAAAIALATWAGFVVGPAVLLAASVLPARVHGG